MSNKSVKGITVEIGAETTGLTKALKNIDSQSSKLQKELKEVEKLLKLDPTNTELLAQKQQLLAKSVESVQTKLQALKSSQSQIDKAFSNNADWEKAYTPLKTQIDTTREKLDKLKSKQTDMERKLSDGKISTEKYESYRKELENVELEYQNLQKSKRNLEKEFDKKGGHLDEEAYRSYQRELIATEQELERLQKAHSDTASSTNDFSSQLSAVSSACDSISDAMQPVTDKILELSKNVYDVSTEFENSMSKLSIIADTDISDGTGKSMTELKSEILSLSDATGIASSELAQYTYDAISAGQATEDATGFVSNATKLAKVGFTDTGTALDALTTILNAYKLESGEASKIGDMLLTTQKEGKITVGELSQSIGKLIPTAQSANVSVDQLCAGYIELTKNGVQATYATTYMNSMLDELNKTGSDTDVALRKMTASVQAVSDEQYSILENQYELSEKSLEKSLEKREQYVEKSYEQQNKDLEKSIEKEISAKEKELQQSIDMINEEYTERLKLNDEEKYNAIKQIENQIDKINAQTEAEEQAIEDRENAQKRASYEEKIANAETIEERQQAEQDLYEFEENLALKQRKKERQAQIDALKEQQDSIKEYYENKATEIQDEQKKQVELQEETNQNILDSFKETQNLKLDKLEEQKKRELENVQEVNDKEKQLWQETWNEKLDIAKNCSSDGMGFADLIADGKTMADVLLMLQDYCDKTGTSFADLWSKTNARKSANILLSSADEYAEKLEVVRNSDGATTEAMEKLNTTTAKVDKSINRVKNSGIELGSTMLDMLAPALNSITEIISNFTTWFNGLSKGTQTAIITISTIVALIAPIAKLISGVSRAIQTVITILPTLLNIISLIKTAVTGLFSFFIANPVGLVITAIAMVIATLVILYQKCEGFRNFVDTFFGEFSDNWAIGMDLLKEKWTSFKTTFIEGTEFIKEDFKQKIENIKNFWINLFGSFVGKLTEFKSDCTEIASYVAEWFSDKIHNFVENWKIGLQEIKDFFKNVFDSLVDIVKTPINGILYLVNQLINGINVLINDINSISIDTPDWMKENFGIGDIGFNIPNIPSIPYLAKGGVLSAGSAVVGERGPEMLTMMGNHAVVQPLTSQNVDNTVKLATQSQSAQFNKTIEIPVYLYHSSSEFARAVITANQLNECMNGGR